jgi:hypothetical protein
MTKVKFSYNFKKDAWAWVRFAMKKGDIYGHKNNLGFIPLELLEKINKVDRESAEKIVYDYLLNNPKKEIRKFIINQEIKSLKETWVKLESKFFKRLEKVTQKPIFTKEFGAYFNSCFMCPYNEKENWFMINMWSGLPNHIGTICHEIMHLQFSHYYREYCRKVISEEQFQDIKEALTFMLNTDFGDIMPINDSGYPNHQILRQKLQEIWEKEKDFKALVDKAIEIVKNNLA